MTGQRRPRGLGLSLAVGLACLAVTGPTWGAAHSEITVGEGTDVNRSYPPIPGNDPSVAAGTPSQCHTVPSCDVIPLKIRLPANSADNDVSVTVKLSWPTTDVAGRRSNDMSLYIWNDPEAFAPVASSTANYPETLNLVNPLPAYQIVVVNVTGVNSGYTIDATYSTEKIDRFESVEQSPRPPTPSGGGGGSAAGPGAGPGSAPSPTGEASGGTPPSPSPSSSGSGEAFASTDTTLPLAEIGPDGDLSALAQRGGGLDDLLRAPSAPEVRSPSRGPAAPVSTVAALLWVVVAPLAVLAAVFAALRRWRADAIVFE